MENHHRRRRPFTDDEWTRVAHIFGTRGVTRDVAEERPYVAYQGGDDGRWVYEVRRFMRVNNRQTRIPDEYAVLELGERVAGYRYQDQGPFAAIPEKQRYATIAKDVQARDEDGHPIDGLVMVKHPVRGDPYPPQLRPDKDPDVTTHDHADYKSASVRRRHEAGKKHDERGVRVVGEHAHRHGKYKIAASPIATTYYLHAHPGRWKRGGCRHKPLCQTIEEHSLRHVNTRKPRGHGGEDDTDGLTHRHPKRGRDPDAPSYGQRIDIHPRTAELWEREAPRRIWFCLEGNLKNDALVSRDEVTVNVPSVTMWPAPELEEFALERLQGVPVFVVPDSDWIENELVASQAFLCVTALRSCGVDAWVAAPTPEPADCELHGEPAGSKRGVDDYLADGGDLNEMTVYSRRLRPEFGRWAAAVKLDRRLGNIAARDRLVDVVEWAALHAGVNGRILQPGRRIARWTGISRDRVEAAVNAMTMLEAVYDRYDDVPAPPFTVSVEELDMWERARDLVGKAYRATVIEVREFLRAETDDRYTVGTLNGRSSLRM